MKTHLDGNRGVAGVIDEGLVRKTYHSIIQSRRLEVGLTIDVWGDSVK